MNSPHLYNIKIINTYINYIEKHYPDVDISSILEYAGLTEYELEDAGYWFTQEQADRFYEITVKKTGNINIARDAGRFILKSSFHNTIRQYVLGFVTVEAAYSSAGHIASKLTRGGTLKMRKLGHNKVEVIARPAKDVIEKPYQCNNRLGMLEALPTAFISKFADIEHPLCIHKGDEYCKYIISWDEPASFKLKLIRNYLSLFSVLLFIASFIFLPVFYSIIIFLLCSGAVLGLSNYYEQKKYKELLHASESQGNIAGELLEEINNRYNNALLVQEIGQAISSILDLEDLLKCVMQIIERRTDFDRGVILLANDNATRLVYKTGYGYDQEKEQILKNTEFHLDRPESKGIFVKTFKEQKPFLINDVNDIIMDMSPRSKEFADLIGAKSFITVPIVFKEKSLGILAVDNVGSKRPLAMSDMNLLSGIAQQIGISINNARSFIQLQASEEKYRELVENANSIIIRIDTEGRILFFNEFAQKFFSYTEKELLGKNLTSAILPDDSQYENKFQKMLNEIERNPGEYLNIQTENIVKNMEKVWIAWTNRPIFNSEGKLKEILCVGNDITELRRVEQERKSLQEQLFQSAKMSAVGQLAAGVAHEFNNILHVILGHAQLSLSEDSITNIKESLQHIEKVTWRASDIVQRLSEFAKPQEPDFAIQDIVEVIQETVKLQRKQIQLENIDVKLEFGEHSEVLFDRDQMEQVFLNLLINSIHAIKPIGKGNIIISVMNINKHLEIRFSDTGIGMSKETMNKIFDPFFTTKGAWAKDNLGITGTGLGLSVTHAIIKQHNGTISVESEEGKGTTFIIKLPIPEEKDIKKIKKNFNKINMDNKKSKDLKIMVIDDDEEMINLMKLILKKAGFNNFVAEKDGTQAVRVFREFGPDVVFLDMLMPIINGEQVFEELKLINRAVPVIFMTGKVNGKENEYRNLGAYDFLKKPFNTDSLFNILNKISGEKERATL